MADVTSPFAFPYPEDTDLVRNGAADIEALATGVNDYLAGGFLYAGTRYYTSSGTFLKADPLGTGDIGLRAIRVRLVAGGGGGGGATATGSTQVSLGQSGGGGGYAEAFILASALSSSEVVTRGAGGAAGGPGAGVGGGTSLFASPALVQAAGGGGGATLGPFTVTTDTNGVAGGLGVVGDLLIQGDGSNFGLIDADRTTKGATMSAGGNSPLGRGGFARASYGNRGGNGADAKQGFGGGGSGATNGTSQVARIGGTGSNGLIIIDCFV
jgi:hypothetical protein